MKRTREMLDTMPKKNRDYLDNLKSAMAKMRDNGYEKVEKEYKNVGKGYIKGMVDCGILDSFKVAWCWFSTY